MNTKACDYTQALIDKSNDSSLGFIDNVKVLIHTSICPDCREYSNRNNLLTKVNNLKSTVRRNSYQANVLHKSSSIQDRLASFPEQNPSPILEIEKSGFVSYQNPAFFNHFPHVSNINVDHEFLKHLKLKFNELIDGTIKEFSKEIYYNGTYYIKRASYLPELQVVRVFYLDITEQKKYEQIISEKNKEITDSIRYAKRIQEAILPSNTIFKNKFPESFVLYNPKDIVAGDFYWLLEIDNWIYVAAADCTGHGVPGALVSVVCNNALNRSVKEYGFRETGQILDKTRDLVLETFTNNDSVVQDGMDISLAAFNKNTGELFWSGANNPLWYYSNSAISEITAHKQPIGKADNPTPYKTHKLDLQKGDYVFLFTDGYADQFGGDHEKKFKYKQMQELILQNISKTPDELKAILNETIDNWKGDFEQTDDILVIGIKL